ncbi:hypothetical protein [Halorubrum ruber]|uniref:Uncharacterized protein n=1 Tax=Halorubrum ruber TaxID=2982524 RepID=A0A8T8LK22_9EURY|nr:hypothetical protein [Halorubrum ruber]QUO46841.1 hypothetical protein J7656_09465 [Halorubrum ruber]
MSEKQPSSDRRSFARGVLTIAGAGAIAGCTGNTGSTEEEGNSGLEESDTNPAGNGSDTGDSESAEDNSSDPEEGQEEEEQTPQWEKDTRNGIPLNGLGAYTDQMIEAGPVSATRAETINSVLEGAETVEEERDALVEELSKENYASIFSEYHRIKGKRDNAENSVVLNRNWSFTSDSESIFEFYKVENGELQSQPVILDPDPETYNRQVNRPGSGEPEYLADLRDNTDWAQNVAQDYQSVQALIERGIENNDATEEEVRDYRADKLQDWSYVIFGADDEPNVRPHDIDTANTVFEAMYGDGNAQILAELSNEYHNQEYRPEKLVEVEFGGDSWNFHTPENREMGDPLIGEEERFS